MFAPHLPALGTRLERCSFDGCGAFVRPSAMADHWITAFHYLRAVNAAGIRVRAS